MSKWTLFWDMHSGGRTKTEYDEIYIQADRETAIRIFQMLFNQDPFDVACPCCGVNFIVSEHDSLEQASAYHRNCRWDKTAERYVEEPGAWPNGKLKDYIPVSEYVKQPHVGVFYVEPNECIEGAKLVPQLV